MHKLAFSLLLFFVASQRLTTATRAESPSSPRPLPQAHSHNDYQHERPLLDALDRGFCNVEADVHLVGDQLLVGHEEKELRPERMLEALYLQPLKQLVAARDGQIFPDGQRLTLLIDFKTDGPSTYAALANVLKRYDGIISGMSDGRWEPRLVDVIISGNRPTEIVAQDDHRMASIDGRLSDLRGDAPAELMPLISDNWNAHFTWRGEGPIPAAERKKLHSLAKAAHAQNRRLRFWATPDSPPFWQELQAAGVDMIGTDDLALLQAHLTSPSK